MANPNLIHFIIKCNCTSNYFSTSSTNIRLNIINKTKYNIGAVASPLGETISHRPGTPGKSCSDETLDWMSMCNASVIATAHKTLFAYSLVMVVILKIYEQLLN